MQEKGKGMYYIDLNDKQKSFIYSKCSVKHIKDVGSRSIMYKRLNINADFINTFVTNFNEKFLYEPYVEIVKVIIHGNMILYMFLLSMLIWLINFLILLMKILFEKDFS